MAHYEGQSGCRKRDWGDNVRGGGIETHWSTESQRSMIGRDSAYSHLLCDRLGNFFGICRIGRITTQ